MSKIWIPGGGGGADLDVVTAGAGDVLSGKVIVDKNGNPLAGTMPNKTGTALTVATNGKTLIPQGYHDGTQYATNSQATLAGGTLTPSTSQVTVSCNGKLMTSNYVIPAFSLPSASVIKKGTKVTIYGKSVTGTFEGYVTSPLYIFNNGKWNGLQTTGWNIIDGNDAGSYIYYTCSWSSSSSRTYQTEQSCLKQTFDLTNYKYLKITTGVYSDSVGEYRFPSAVIALSKTYNLSTNICNDDGTLNTKSYPYGNVSGPSGTAILDVSNVSGSYYIYVGMKYYLSGSNRRYGLKLTQLFATNT